jgi:hypothetical protein
MSGATVPAEKTDDDAQAETSVSAASGQADIERELTHEDYDPKGTLALIVIYMAILVAMWIFMYFVEFLGNDLVVVG